MGITNFNKLYNYLKERKGKFHFNSSTRYNISIDGHNLIYRCILSDDSFIAGNLNSNDCAIHISFRAYKYIKSIIERIQKVFDNNKCNQVLLYLDNQRAITKEKRYADMERKETMQLAINELIKRCISQNCNIIISGEAELQMYLRRDPNINLNIFVTSDSDMFRILLNHENPDENHDIFMGCTMADVFDHSSSLPAPSSSSLSSSSLLSSTQLSLQKSLFVNNENKERKENGGTNGDINVVEQQKQQQQKFLKTLWKQHFWSIINDDRESAFYNKYIDKLSWIVSNHNKIYGNNTAHLTVFDEILWVCPRDAGCMEISGMNNFNVYIPRNILKFLTFLMGFDYHRQSFITASMISSFIENITMGELLILNNIVDLYYKKLEEPLSNNDYDLDRPYMFLEIIILIIYFCLRNKCTLPKGANHQIKFDDTVDILIDYEHLYKQYDLYLKNGYVQTVNNIRTINPQKFVRWQKFMINKFSRNTQIIHEHTFKLYRAYYRQVCGNMEQTLKYIHGSIQNYKKHTKEIARKLITDKINELQKEQSQQQSDTNTESDVDTLFDENINSHEDSQESNNNNNNNNKTNKNVESTDGCCNSDIFDNNKQNNKKTDDNTIIDSTSSSCFNMISTTHSCDNDLLNKFDQTEKFIDKCDTDSHNSQTVNVGNNNNNQNDNINDRERQVEKKNVMLTTPSKECYRNNDTTTSTHTTNTNNDIHTSSGEESDYDLLKFKQKRRRFQKKSSNNTSGKFNLIHGTSTSRVSNVCNQSPEWVRQATTDSTMPEQIISLTSMKKVQKECTTSSGNSRNGCITKSDDINNLSNLVTSSRNLRRKLDNNDSDNNDKNDDIKKAKINFFWTNCNGSKTTVPSNREQKGGDSEYTKQVLFQKVLKSLSEICSDNNDDKHCDECHDNDHTVNVQDVNEEKRNEQSIDIMDRDTIILTDDEDEIPDKENTDMKSYTDDDDNDYELNENETGSESEIECNQIQDDDSDHSTNNSENDSECDKLKKSLLQSYSSRYDDEYIEESQYY